MAKNSLRGMVVVAVFGLVSFVAGDVRAQCCGTPATAYYQPSAAYYQPTAYTSYYAPATYQASRPLFGGWYPGKVLGRINRAIWGVPETYASASPSYAASYPTAYAAAYPATYTAAYAPTYTASYAPAYTASYAPAYAASYAPTYSAGYAATTAYAAPATYTAPACTTCAMPVCDPCAASGVPATSTVTQAVYGSPSNCPTCEPAYHSYPSNTSAPAQAHSETPPSTYQQQPEPQPTLPSDAMVPPREEVQRQPVDRVNEANGTDDELEPQPLNDDSNAVPGSSTRLEAPPLFLNPQDRTAGLSTAPVHMAVLHRPVSESSISAQPISRQQAQQHAAGWVSASE